MKNSEQEKLNKADLPAEGDRKAVLQGGGLETDDEAVVTTQTLQSEQPEKDAALEVGSPNPTPSIEVQLAEAEQRGYLRGRNERIEELMREPAPFARQSAPAVAAPANPFTEPSSEPMILNNPRISIWDR